MSTGSAVLDFPVRRQTLGPAGAGVTLVVESDPGAARSLLAQLFADGFRVELARTAEHARMLLVRRPPRLVVIGGLSSPRGAVELLQEIRATARWAGKVPVIVLGTQANELEMLRAFETGADDFMERSARIPGASGAHASAAAQGRVGDCAGASPVGRVLCRSTWTRTPSACMDCRSTCADWSSNCSSIWPAIQSACSQSRSCCAPSGDTARTGRHARSTATPAGCAASCRSAAGAG